jgi:hypothetical protein
VRPCDAVEAREVQAAANSIFESSMNFKRGSNHLEKSNKFTKNFSSLDLHKSEFSWAHLYVRIRVTTQVSKRLGLNKKKRV